MSRLGNISGKDAVRVFQKYGWYFVGQVGSHVVLSKDGEKANLSIPQHKELSIGTLRSLIKSANLTVDEFIEKL